MFLLKYVQPATYKSLCNKTLALYCDEVAELLLKLKV